MLRFLFAFIITLVSVNFSVGNVAEFKPIENNETSVINDVMPRTLRKESTINDLYLDDYYANYYFVNSIENYGRNVKGSCTQLAWTDICQVDSSK